ncbi:unnamed protein product [Owenia fusiformis]|uniref:SRCR domain-containing protein n=1 Tax=Owenia fusiformis TaxID=6347 RepID=A0A8S4P6K2_OWEFU|nr:unnamed protein product [Owenia fusiformis]
MFTMLLHNIIVVFSASVMTIESKMDDFDVQLSGYKGVEGQGRVGIFYKKRWRRVCNYGWDKNDAKVICRQLGYDSVGSEAQLYNSDSKTDRINPRKWGNVSGTQYGIHSVMCHGNETFIGECKMKLLKRSKKCKENHDAIAICKKDDSDNDLRISDIGRVELKHDGVWGLVCYTGNANQLEKVLADVSCRQLGYEFGLVLEKDRRDYRGPIRLYDIVCDGTERKLQECSTFRRIYETGSSCNYIYAMCPEKFRVGKGLTKSGILEVLISNKWYNVCGPSPKTACNWLGLEMSPASEAERRLIDTSFQSAWIGCDDEEELSKCRWISMTDWKCGFTCSDEPDKSAISEAVIRLTEGSSGYLEVLVDDEWLTVCSYDRSFGIAKAVCQQLGYKSIMHVSITRDSISSPEEQEFIETDICCRGSEKNLGECSYSIWKKEKKSYCRAASITCDVFPIRLSEQAHGDLQVSVNGTWVPVCTYRNGWRIENSQVICKHLGFSPGTVLTMPGSLTREKNDYVGIYNLACDGSENAIYECENFVWGGGSSCGEKVYVVCDMLNATKVHLKDSDGTSGKPEILNRRLCSNNWTETEASVICQNLGFPPEGAIPQYYDQRTALSTSNSSWFQCNETDSGTGCLMREDQKCKHHNVAVKCLDHQPGIHEYIRAKTEFPFAGQVEVYISPDQKGAVCATGWGTKETQVLCRQTGAFNEPDRKPIHAGVDTNNLLGGRDDPIVMSDVKCNGDEANIAECTFKSGIEASCSSNRRVRVYCHQLEVWKLEWGGLIQVNIKPGQENGWRWMCGDDMTRNTSDVFCLSDTGKRILSSDYGTISIFSVPSKLHFRDYYPRHILTWPMVNARCVGDELSLGQCDLEEKKPYTCKKAALISYCKVEK